MRRFCSPLLIATGVLHMVVGLVVYAQPLAAVAGDGLFNAVEKNPAQFDREAAFWFMFFGALFVILAGQVHWALNRTGTLPSFLGWGLLVLGAVGAILMPASGFWLVIPQAVLLLAVARQGRVHVTFADAGSSG